MFDCKKYLWLDYTRKERERNTQMNANNNEYRNVETKCSKGGKMKTVRKVVIKGGKGYKSITRYVGGRRVHSVKKRIHNDHIDLIHAGKFVKGLFNDCLKCRQDKKHNRRRNQTRKVF